MKADAKRAPWRHAQFDTQKARWGFAAVVALLTLCGCRLEENAGASWPDADRFPIEMVPKEAPEVEILSEDTLHYRAWFLGLPIGRASLSSQSGGDGRVYLNARLSSTALGSLIQSFDGTMRSEIDPNTHRPHGFEFKTEDDDCLVPSRVSIDREKGLAHMERTTESAQQSLYLDIDDPLDALSLYLELSHLELSHDESQVYEIVGPAGRFYLRAVGQEAQDVTVADQDWLQARVFRIDIVGSPNDTARKDQVFSTYTLWCAKELGGPLLKLVRDFAIGSLNAELITVASESSE